MSTKSEPKITKVNTSTTSVVPLQVPANPVAPVTEEVLVVKCTNVMEAVAHEKQLHSITEAALKWFQKGLNANPDDKILKEVYPNMICEFKATVKQVYNPVHRANRGEILNCVEDPEAECVWNRDDMRMMVTTTNLWVPQSRKKY